VGGRGRGGVGVRWSGETVKAGWMLRDGGSGKDFGGGGGEEDEC